MASLSLASVAWQKKNDKGLGRRNGLQIFDDVNHKHCLSLPGVCSHPQELGRLTMFPVCKGRLVQNPCRRFRQQSTIATLNALHIMLRISNAQVLQTLFVLIFLLEIFLQRCLLLKAMVEAMEDVLQGSCFFLMEIQNLVKNYSILMELDSGSHAPSYGVIDRPHQTC